MHRHRDDEAGIGVIGRIGLLPRCRRASRVERHRPAWRTGRSAAKTKKRRKIRRSFAPILERTELIFFSMVPEVASYEYNKRLIYNQKILQ
jgi:hypothetical protein